MATAAIGVRFAARKPKFSHYESKPTTVAKSGVHYVLYNGYTTKRYLDMIGNTLIVGNSASTSLPSTTTAGRIPKLPYHDFYFESHLAYVGYYFYGPA